jgi:hypothetical protein
MKALQKNYEMHLYVVANVAIKPNWQGLIELANATRNNDFENDNLEQTFSFIYFKKNCRNHSRNYGETLVQNILHPEQIIDDDSKTLIIVPIEGFQPLGLFCDQYSKKYKFFMLFYGNSRPSFTCSYQKIV